MNILFLGCEWAGSDAKGLAEGFRRLGHPVFIVDEDCYRPNYVTIPGKIVRRLIAPIIHYEYDGEVLRRDELMQPDLVVVFKGQNLGPQTLKTLKGRGRTCVLFYPDVSLFAHGKRIPGCIPLYDEIFTTKSFMIEDLKQYFNRSEKVYFLPNAAAPDIHREMPYDAESAAIFSCDVSFIAQYSPKKERVLAELVRLLPEINLKIWGPNWQRCNNPILQPFIQGKAPHGDLYTQAIQYTRINLAILSEARLNSSSGDLITARTFQIPACGGFMLHERTAELQKCYQEGVETACFDSAAEMAQKITYYLQHPEEREQIRKAGRLRTEQEHLFEHRARAMLQLISKKKS